ncbi:formylglycine-generating enzyme family protein [Candidatus Latescibacterota bacterium]
MKSIVLVMLLLVCCLFCKPTTGSTAERPAWVDNNGISSHYPSNIYVTGYGVGEDSDLSNRRFLAEQNARSDLSAKFFYKISSELVSVEKNKSDTESTVDLRNRISSKTQFTLIGVEKIIFDDLEHKRSYAFVALEIEPAIENYTNYLNEISVKIADHVRSAVTAEKNSDIKECVSNYRKSQSLIAEFNDIRTILNVLTSKTTFTKKRKVYTQATESEIEMKINRLLRGSMKSVSQAAYSLAEQLNAKTDSDYTFAVYPLTYANTELTTGFSSYFLQFLEAELTQFFDVMSLVESGSNSFRANKLIGGTYWKEEKNVRVFLYVKDNATGTKISSATVIIPLGLLEREKIELVPGNLQGRGVTQRNIVQPGQTPVNSIITSTSKENNTPSTNRSVTNLPLDDIKPVELLEPFFGIMMAPVPSGIFQMGSTYSDDPQCPDNMRNVFRNEMPVHTVVVDEFFISKTEVTQDQYFSVTGENPSNFRGGNLPVESVSWYDAVEFCNRLSVITGLEKCYNEDTWLCDYSKNGFRLPTEAEWEYACRSETTSHFNVGPRERDLGMAAWYEKNKSAKTHPVGRKIPNIWGLYDMHGNVSEWCNDFYKRDFYTTSGSISPYCNSYSPFRVRRGGSINSTANQCRSTHRGMGNPKGGFVAIGFRIVSRALPEGY